MKNLTIFLFTIFALSSCGTGSSNASKEQMTGNDKDAHGCIGSAGFTWSETYQECVRAWEVGTTLKPLDSKSTSNAYVILSQDHSKVELFLPDSRSSVMLESEDHEVFVSTKYEYHVDNHHLKIDGKLTYQ
ncbi:hypothetical protein MY04_4466 [Flammeovirga sp. MY04]|uniref:hypothetical protein n=1 Tax=Flammeovirga sp. MY04 TaxID=1191459 RepID=UPI000AA65C06|nr:hypothetical protein [Flammeovirga sp. MY04]ANQ51802.2 hypothetical protein MY04_4466 [Flammeovirga sp. MY04]